MKIKEAFSQSKKSYLSHPLNSWVLGIVCALFIAALCGFDFIIPGLYYIIIPLIGIPFFFAVIISHYQLKTNNEIRTRSFIQFFAVYFTKPFRSSFRVIFSFFKSLLIETGLTIILFIGLYLFFTNAYGSSFNSNFAGFFETIGDASLSATAYNEAIQGYLSANNNMLYVFFNLIFIPANFAGGIAFIYFISLESFSIMARLAFPQNPPTFIRMAVKGAIKKQGKSFYGTYLGLNWPLYLLLLIGAVSGIVITLQFTSDMTLASTIGMISGLGLTSFFLPFYLNNMEAIYSLLASDVRSASQHLMKQMIQDIQMQKHLNEQEKELLNKTLEDLKDSESGYQPDQDNQVGDENDDSGKEKDPFNGSDK